MAEVSEHIFGKNQRESTIGFRTNQFPQQQKAISH